MMTPEEVRVCVVGLGYIGLPTASMLATKGFTVQGVDVNPAVVELINRGSVHFREPDLDVLVRSAVQSGRLTASMEPSPADIFIIAVPTPLTPDHAADISHVETATRAIAPHVAPGNIVILESTSPVGTTERVAASLRDLRQDLEIAGRPKTVLPSSSGAGPVYIAHCPERVLPGQILKELVENDRVIGGTDQASAERAGEFYKTFVSGRIFLTNARTAEMCKLAENAFRDVNIAYANELALVCDILGVDVWELIELANHHPRVNILQPGPGVGGHCIAVDPWFLVHSAPDQTRLIAAAREVNDSRPTQIVAKVKALTARLNRPVIACLGLAFKANVDDIRGSPAIAIVKRLAEERAGTLLVVEPHLSELPAELAALPVEMAPLVRALDEADIVVLLVDHRAFATVSREMLNQKIVIDTRGLWRARP
jgi:UDP-N-acetyl-D-mannosaminuronic acid dehydrogenase